MMMILDSLDAIRWAWILIQISTQDAVDVYIDRFIQLTRKNSQRLQNVKDAWDTFACTIAMRMRTNVTFKQATEEILQDPVIIADILSQPPRKKPRLEKGKTKKGKGKGKNKTKYNQWNYQPRYQPYQPPANTSQYSTTSAPVPNPPYHYGPPPQPPNPFPPSPPKGGQKGHKGKQFQQKGGSKNNNK